jgi:secreted trypsin-like serine protease
LNFFVNFPSLSAQHIERRIIGGEENALGDIPYVVSISIFTGLHICTGSIINQWWVVTAAHCIFGRGPNTVLLRPGRIRLDVSNMEDRQGSVLITHPEYDDSVMRNE